jgi:hypothetical protein
MSQQSPTVTQNNPSIHLAVSTCCPHPILTQKPPEPSSPLKVRVLARLLAFQPFTHYTFLRSFTTPTRTTLMPFHCPCPCCYHSIPFSYHSTLHFPHSNPILPAFLTTHALFLFSLKQTIRSTATHHYSFRTNPLLFNCIHFSHCSPILNASSFGITFYSNK